MNYNWKTDEYINLVEKTNNYFLRDFIDKELDYLSSLKDLQGKTFVDVGSGYGRVVPVLAPLAARFVAVEIDTQMLEELNKTVSSQSNCSVVECDAQDLCRRLEPLNIVVPVVMSLQNSLGTPYGDTYKIIRQMVDFAKNKKGEIIISLFKQETLRDCGMSIYNSISGLVGEIDMELTNFEHGDFISKTGYKSHWFSADERERIKDLVGGTIVFELEGNCFYIIHSKY